MSSFVPGVELCGRFYQEVVGPVLRHGAPDLAHAAALLGRGSEVLGYDDETSTDHDWRPRVLLFLAAEDEHHSDEVRTMLQRDLPPSYEGRPGDVEIHTVRGYVLRLLGVDLERDLGAGDWLTLSEQRLRMFTAGAVFHDDVGLQQARDRLSYYPRDVWLYLLVTGWWRVHPEMNLVGRAGSVGDELGSSLIGARLVMDLMRLAFLMERQYAPYSKWFGTAFARLRCGPQLTPLLQDVQGADSWQGREAALSVAYEHLFAMHDALGLTAPVTSRVERLWDRPFAVAWADIPDLLMPLIQDPDVLRIARRWPVGPVDQLRDLFWPVTDRPRLLRVLEEP